MAAASWSRSFDALGGQVAIEAHGRRARDSGERAVAAVADLQDRLTRFDPRSELSLLNSDPRRSVPASPVMMRFASLIRYAGELSEGLVDATCLDAVEQSGYTRSLAAAAIPAEVAALAGSDGNKVVPAGRDPRERWKTVSTDPVRNEVTRPPGVRLDSGGIGKGLAADAAAETLADCESYSVSCAGDIRFGGGAGLEREIFVASPKQGEGPVARITSSEAAVATSGVTKRSWVDGSGRPAHHLIDPRTGRPVRSGVLQATAIAPTGVEAEIRAKAALLSGPGGGERWLVHGGAMVTSGGEVLTFGRCVEKVRSDP